MSQGVAERIVSEGAAQPQPVAMRAVSMADYKRKELQALAEAQSTAVLLLQTVENNEPPESAGGFLRFFKRKNHPEGMLAGTDEGHVALPRCYVPIMGILHMDGAKGMTVRPAYRPVSWRSQSWHWETATCSWTARRPRPRTARSAARTSIRGSATRGW